MASLLQHLDASRRSIRFCERQRCCCGRTQNPRMQSTKSKASFAISLDGTYHLSLPRIADIRSTVSRDAARGTQRYCGTLILIRQVFPPTEAYATPWSDRLAYHTFNSIGHLTALDVNDGDSIVQLDGWPRISTASNLGTISCQTQVIRPQAQIIQRVTRLVSAVASLRSPFLAKHYQQTHRHSGRADGLEVLLCDIAGRDATILCSRQSQLSLQH